MHLSCYYLDQALDEQEHAFVVRTLLGPWARFKTGARELREVRVPAVLPLPDAAGGYGESREARAHRVCANLRHAGIRADAGRRVVWITPADPDWDAIFQFAIREETGYAPYVAQRWFLRDGALMRDSLRVVDTEMLLRGLER